MDALHQYYSWNQPNIFSRDPTSLYLDHARYLNNRTWFIFSTITLILLSLAGNVFVICRIVRQPPLRAKHLLFLNLSSADILVTLTGHLYLVVSIWLEYYLTVENALCKMLLCLRVLIEAGSIYAVLAITVDQFQVIVKPPCRYITKKVAIVGSWLLALLPALPHLYTAGEDGPVTGSNPCILIGSLEQEMSTEVIYFSLRFTLYFYLPTIIGTILYAVVFLKSKPQNCHVVPSRNYKLFILSLTLFTIVPLTSIPFSIEHLVLLFSNHERSTLQLDGWLYFVLLSRNAINPLVYILLHFKEVFRRRALEGSGSVSLVPTKTRSTESSSTGMIRLTNEST